MMWCTPAALCTVKPRWTSLMQAWNAVQGIEDSLYTQHPNAWGSYLASNLQNPKLKSTTPTIPGLKIRKQTSKPEAPNLLTPSPFKPSKAPLGPGCSQAARWGASASPGDLHESYINKNMHLHIHTYIHTHTYYVYMYVYIYISYI